MAAKKAPRDVLVVPHYDDAVGQKKVGGRRIMPGDVMVVSACAGPKTVEGLLIGAIHVDDRCLTTGILNDNWATEIIEALLAGADR